MTHARMFRTILINPLNRIFTLSILLFHESYDWYDESVCMFDLYTRVWVRVYVCACVYVRVRMRVYTIYNIFNI